MIPDGQRVLAPAKQPRKLPAKESFQFIRAPPHLVVSWKQAQNDYRDAIYYCWYTTLGHGRDDKPTPEVKHRIQADRFVREAAEKLDALDATLMAHGTVVDSVMFKLDWEMNRRLEEHEHRLDVEYREQVELRSHRLRSSVPAKRDRESSEDSVLSSSPTAAESPAEDAENKMRFVCRFLCVDLAVVVQYICDFVAV